MNFFRAAAFAAGPFPGAFVYSRGAQQLYPQPPLEIRNPRNSLRQFSKFAIINVAGRAAHGFHLPVDGWFRQFVISNQVNFGLLLKHSAKSGARGVLPRWYSTTSRIVRTSRCREVELGQEGVTRMHAQSQRKRERAAAKTVPGDTTRPITDLVKAFNILGDEEGIHVLDLFGGTGAVGINAEPRAVSAFLDKAKRSAQCRRTCASEADGESPGIAYGCFYIPAQPPSCSFDLIYRPPQYKHVAKSHGLIGPTARSAEPRRADYCN